LSTLAAQFLHACSDRREIIGCAGSGAFAAQFLHACPDHYKIVSDAGSAHVSSVYLVGVGSVDRAIDNLLGLWRRQRPSRAPDCRQRIYLDRDGRDKHAVDRGPQTVAAANAIRPLPVPCTA
jgi:hypothetical protein